MTPKPDTAVSAASATPAATFYELITGCNLHLAPTPYRIGPNEERILYHDFVVGLPRSLVEALHNHAQGILHRAGITDEPLEWEPPPESVTVTNWPGADPERTDPDRIHRGLLAPRTATWPKRSASPPSTCATSSADTPGPTPSIPPDGFSSPPHPPANTPSRRSTSIRPGCTRNT
jgi:hypothetical protein